MEEKRKRSAWIGWFVVLLFLGYPLSLGPALWLDHHGYFPGRSRELALAFYSPIQLLHAHGPAETRGIIDWYAEFWER